MFGEYKFEKIINCVSNLFQKINPLTFGIISFAVILLAYLISGIEITTSIYLWAEDGNIFLQQAIDNGWMSIFTPYAGYQHLIPRLVTLVAFSIGMPFNNLVLIASIMKWVTILISVLFLWYFTTNDFDWLIKNRWARLIAVLCVPIWMTIFPETYCNITNIQWWGGIFVFLAGLILIHGKFPPIWVLVSLILIAFSTPYCPIILILFLVYALRKIFENKTNGIHNVISNFSKKEITYFMLLTSTVFIHSCIILSHVSNRVKFDFWASPLDSIIELMKMFFISFSSVVNLIIIKVLGIANVVFNNVTPIFSKAINFLNSGDIRINYLVAVGVAILIIITVYLIWKHKLWIALYLLFFVGAYIGLAFYTSGIMLSYNRYYAAPGIAVWIILFTVLYSLFNKIPVQKIKIIITLISFGFIFYLMFANGGVGLYPDSTYLLNGITDINQYVNFSSDEREWVNISPNWGGEKNHWGIDIPINLH